MKNSVDTGNIGEDAVAKLLSDQGYLVIARNWKRKISEIDIVATKDNEVYFVEVKTRSTNNQGDGFDYITASKLKHMERAAELWVAENRWAGPYQMVVASVCDGEINILEV